MTEEEKQKLNDEKKQDAQLQEPPEITMTITLKSTGGIAVKSPVLNDKIFTYGLLKAAEKTLDGYYAELNRKSPQKHGILDFVRGGLKH